MGVATVALPVTSTPGTGLLRATFPGDLGYLGSGDSRSLLIPTLGTSITITAASTTPLLGADSGLLATLRDANGVALGFRAIDFLVTGPGAGGPSFQRTLNTDYAGRIALGALPYAVGAYTIKACFSGPGAPCPAASVPDPIYNPSVATTTLRVIYRFDGFLQPINDTAHTTYCGAPCVASIFKGGSTVPVKFQLKDAFGVVVQSAALPMWLTPIKGGPVSAAIDESSYSDPGTSGNQFKWDPTSRQYSYNWSTKGFAIGYYWRVGVTLEDGQTYAVYVGLK